MNEIILQNKNGVPVVSSREIAEHFGKQHNSVLKTIYGENRNGKHVDGLSDEILASGNPLTKYFIESTYENRGKQYKECLMTRDGFSLTVMGFVGKKATAWKLKYIDAFNKMEESLKNQSTKMLPTTYKEALVQLLEKVEENEKLIEENNHKQEVINGLTDDIDIYKKRVIINRICKRRHGNYANRYKELYKCYRETFHIDLEARCEGYNLKQVKKKDQLTVIGYAEKFGFIDDLYSCCVKLYETEVNEIIEELRNIQE